MNQIRAPMGGFAFGRSGDELVTSGLGTCVALLLCDRRAELAALAHIMLPHSANEPPDAEYPAQFADHAVQLLADVLESNGAKRWRLAAWSAGGGDLFRHVAGEDLLQTGKRTLDAVRSALLMHRIPLLAEERGASASMSVSFSVAGGIWRTFRKRR